MPSETPLGERLQLEAREARQACQAASAEQKRKEDVLRETKAKWLDDQADLQKAINVNNAVLAAAGKSETFAYEAIEYPEGVVHLAVVGVRDKDQTVKVAMEIRVKPQGHVQIQIPGQHHDDYAVGQMKIPAWNVLLNELHRKLPK